MRGTHRLLALSAAVLLGLALVVPGQAAARGASVSTYSYAMTRVGITYGLEYCANRPVTSPSAAIRTVVLVVHGSGRNACDYASSIADAARTAGQTRSTLIVAPRFVTSDDISSRSSQLYWSSSGWKSGNLSQTSPYARSWRVSSFEAVDSLLSAITGNFTHVHDVVVAGHSAGGQFANRYAAGARWRPAGGVAERFVVANPSSYLYWDDERLTDGAWRPLSSAERTACPGYDDYKYGLLNRNSYMNGLSSAALKANYSAAQVRYLLGSRDTDPNSSSLDTSCEAELQGNQRYERGQRYYSRLPAVFGPTVTDRHTLGVVPGVAHDGDAMFTSSEGVAALFDRSSGGE